MSVNFEIRNKLLSILNKKLSLRYYSVLFFFVLLSISSLPAFYITLTKGLGDWGINNQVSWGVSIANFIFWIGIAHAGTLISAVLFLFNQHWRVTVNRSAEAMTIFALISAIIFPIIHTGRPWFSLYWLIPYPNQMGIWPNFKSPLVWDVFAIGTYFILSLLFWYIGLLPDIASLKKDIRSKFVRKVYSYFSFSFTGCMEQWKSYKTVYLILAGLITPLVIAVHSIVSFDFSVAIQTSWHSTIFPPYFVTGAIFSGCATVVFMIILTRYVLKLNDYISNDHLEKLNKIILTCSLIIGVSYLLEFFTAFYNNNIFEKEAFLSRFDDKFIVLSVLMILFNVLLPQLYWFRKIRKSSVTMFLISICIVLGMWAERLIIVVNSLHTNVIAGPIEKYSPSWLELSILFGSIGFFFTFYLIFIKFVPVLSMTEITISNSNDLK